MPEIPSLTHNDRIALYGNQACRIESPAPFMLAFENEAGNILIVCPRGSGHLSGCDSPCVVKNPRSVKLADSEVVNRYLRAHPTIDLQTPDIDLNIKTHDGNGALEVTLETHRSISFARFDIRNGEIRGD